MTSTWSSTASCSTAAMPSRPRRPGRRHVDRVRQLAPGRSANRVHVQVALRMVRPRPAGWTCTANGLLTVLNGTIPDGTERLKRGPSPHRWTSRSVQSVQGRTLIFSLSGRAEGTIVAADERSRDNLARSGQVDIPGQRRRDEAATLADGGEPHGSDRRDGRARQHRAHVQPRLAPRNVETAAAARLRARMG